MIDYFGLLKKSWSDFRNNLALFLPSLFGLLLGIGFLILLGIEVLAFYLIFSGSIFQNPELVIGSMTGIFLCVFFVLIDIVVAMVMYSYVGAMTVGMYKEMIDKRKTTTSIFILGKKYFSSYFWVSLIECLLFLFPIVVLGGICTLAFFGNVILGAIVTILSVLLLIAWFIILIFSLFFIDPIITSQSKSALEIIKYSFRYTKQNLSHVLVTWLVILLVSAIIIGALMIIGLPLNFAGIGVNLTGSTIAKAALTAIGVIFGIIRGVIQLIMQLVLGLFRFNAYFTKK